MQACIGAPHAIVVHQAQRRCDLLCSDVVDLHVLHYEDVSTQPLIVVVVSVIVLSFNRTGLLLSLVF